VEAGLDYLLRRWSCVAAYAPAISGSPVDNALQSQTPGEERRTVHWVVDTFGELRGRIDVKGPDGVIRWIRAHTGVLGCCRTRQVRFSRRHCRNVKVAVGSPFPVKKPAA
jgi:hypothetical protein